MATAIDRYTDPIRSIWSSSEDAWCQASFILSQVLFGIKPWEQFSSQKLTTQDSDELRLIVFITSLDDYG